MDNEFPKITVDIFEFARKHDCTVRLQFEDDMRLKMGLERRGFRHNFAIDVNTLNSLQVTNIDWVVEDALEESIKEIENRERRYGHGVSG